MQNQFPKISFNTLKFSRQKHVFAMFKNKQPKTCTWRMAALSPFFLANVLPLATVLFSFKRFSGHCHCCFILDKLVLRNGAKKLYIYVCIYISLRPYEIQIYYCLCFLSFLKINFHIFIRTESKEKYN